MSGKATPDDIQGHKHHNPAQSVIQVRGSGRSHERRTYLDRCLVWRGQPHLGESEALEIWNLPLKVLPPTQLRMFAVPRKELDLSKKSVLHPGVPSLQATHHDGILSVLCRP